MKQQQQGTSLLVQSVDVLLDRPPHPDLVDDVRRFFRGETKGKGEDETGHQLPGGGRVTKVLCKHLQMEASVHTRRT